MAAPGRGQLRRQPVCSCDFREIVKFRSGRPAKAFALLVAKSLKQSWIFPAKPEIQPYWRL